MRYVFFDTETTGLSYATGDRVFEIGCVEVIDRKKTGKTFSSLLNPEKPLSEASKEICKMTDAELVDKPLFADVVERFLKFLNSEKDTVLVAHNAKFDIGFLNNELAMVGAENLDKFTIIDTLQIARVKFPGSPASLNALSKKFEIGLAGREEKGHGALLDSDILADVFIKMCADDDDNFIVTSNKEEVLFFDIIKRESILQERDFEIEQADFLAHQKILEQIKIELW